MALKKISQLPATGAAVLTDEFEINQGGASKKVTLSQIGGRFGFGGGTAGRIPIFGTGSTSLLDSKIFDTGQNIVVESYDVPNQPTLAMLAKDQYIYWAGFDTDNSAATLFFTTDAANFNGGAAVCLDVTQNIKSIFSAAGGYVSGHFGVNTNGIPSNYSLTLIGEGITNATGGIRYDNFNGDKILYALDNGRVSIGHDAPEGTFDVHGTGIFMYNMASLPAAVSTFAEGGLFGSAKATSITLPTTAIASYLEFDNLGANTTQSYYAFVNSVFYDRNDGTTFAIPGLEFPSMVGSGGSVYIASTSVNIDRIAGFASAYANFAPGAVVDESIGFYAHGIQNAMPNYGTTTKYYAFFAETNVVHSGAPSLANRWGVYINDPCGNYFAGNVGIGTDVFQNSMTSGITLKNGTDPSSNVANQFALYSKDIVAGNAAPHFRTENGDIVKLYKQALSNSTGGAATGDLEDVTTVGLADPAKVNNNFTELYTILNNLGLI